MTELKMFVWDDVLADYTSGIVCVLAHDLKEAFEVIIKTAKDKTNDYQLECWKVLEEITSVQRQQDEKDWIYAEPEEYVKNLTQKPKVFVNPTAVGVYGGG